MLLMAVPVIIGLAAWAMPRARASASALDAGRRRVTGAVNINGSRHLSPVLATKLQALSLSKEGLVGNIVAFNVGVEHGQVVALTCILLAFQLWRRSGSFARGAYAANVVIMTAGFVLVGYQLTGLFTA